MSFIHYSLEAEARYQASEHASNMYAYDEDDSGGEMDEDDINTNGNATQ